MKNLFLILPALLLASSADLGDESRIRCEDEIFGPAPRSFWFSATRAEQKLRAGFGSCFMIAADGVVREYTLTAPRGTEPAFPQLDLARLPDGCFVRCDLTREQTAALAPTFRGKPRP